MSNSINEISVPNPAKGTPWVNQIIDKGIMERKEIAERKTPNRVINFSGLYECAKIPLKAKSITWNVCAFDFPANLSSLSNSTISILYLMCHPPTVRFFIVSVIIYTV
jgi:hypothetical protein